MPQNPVDTLIALTEIIDDLDTVQLAVREMRSLHPRNQLIQLEMDRQQATIDSRRDFVRRAMLDISSRN